MVVGFYQRNPLGQVSKIDCWEGSGTDGRPETAKVLQQRGYVYGKHFAPHDRKAVERGTGKTIEETAKALGIVFQRYPRSA